MYATILTLLSLQSGIADLVTVTNNDTPEALLEGLLQAVVCGGVVGWRSEARKLILIFTDEGYHVAGDGKVESSEPPLTVAYILLGGGANELFNNVGKKFLYSNILSTMSSACIKQYAPLHRWPALLLSLPLSNLFKLTHNKKKMCLPFLLQLAGVIRPHDGNCYVSGVGNTGQLDYTMWGRFDYPSIPQVRGALQDNDIVPVFAAVSELQSVYTVRARIHWLL